MATESFFSNASLAYLASAGAGKDGKTYSIKPTDGTGDFTFSRGTDLTATRVGPTGLIEKGRENLLKQSNQFDTTWVTQNTSVTSGQSGYDGSNDAWLLSKSASNSYIFQDISSSGVQTFSVYAKAETSSWLRLVANTSNFQGGYFDLSNGVTGGVENAIDTKIENVGNGWYRCIVIFNGSTTRVRVYPAEANSTAATTGSIYIQDAQLEIGLAATDYIESGASTGKAGLLENEPRFDYSGGATCPSLLLEPQRVNAWTYSEYLDYPFSGLTNVTITQNTNETLSPEGLYNATKLEGTTSWLFRESISGTNTGTWTISCWVKAVNPSSNNTFRLSLGGNVFSSNLTATSEWKRFDLSVTNGGGTNAGLLRDSSSNDADLYIYGLQVEAGSYPTSYIPNHSGGSATRTKDEGETSTIADVNEGVIFFEGFVDKNENTIKLIELHDGTANNRIFVYYRDSTGLQPRLYAFAINGGTQVYGYAYDIPSGRGEVSHKVAFRFADNNFAMFYNGTQVHTQTSGIVSTNAKNQISFASYLGALNFSGKVKQLLTFTEALSDADCITLTT